MQQKGLKKGQKMTTVPVPIMQDFHVTTPDSAVYAFSTDTVWDKCSGLNELMLKPKPEAQKEKYWDELPHQQLLTKKHT